jgi:UDPglucose 6-dehydrogenase
MTIHIAVYGTDYLGATHATGLAELGHDVLGVDVDVAKLAKLNAGEAPFFEPELEEALQRNIAAGRLRFTSSFEQAATFGDAHFIAVGTPQKRGEFAADMRYIDAVIETLAPLLTKPTVIFGKSTVPVGTARRD